jgi:NDP-sugar pyrophosphorylase family protein
VRITYSVEPEPLGTGGAVRHALTGGYADTDFLVLNGDTYAVLDYAGFLAFHQQRQALATLALVRMADAWDYGTVERGPMGRIVAFREKAREPGGGLVSAGVYAFHPAILAHIPAGRPVSLEEETFPALVRAGRAIYGCITGGTFYDIGTPQRYREFERQVEEGAIP